MTISTNSWNLRGCAKVSQHELLLELERSGNEVYYSAPAFHEPKELDDAYLKNKVKNRSIWIKPTDINDITDTKELT